MAKAYLIGGAPRIGKSNLAMQLIAHRPMYATSTGALCAVLRQVLNKEEVPDLFHDSIGESADMAIAAQVRESAITWRSTVAFVNKIVGNGMDVVVEGITVMPSFVAQLECGYSAVFIGDQSPGHFKTIKDTAKGNTSDWLNTLDDITIHAVCEFNLEFSRYIESEAKSHGQTYIEVDDNNYSESMAKALDHLLG
jgi:2-phosphoglycerate kinase